MKKSNPEQSQIHPRSTPDRAQIDQLEARPLDPPHRKDEGDRLGDRDCRVVEREAAKRRAQAHAAHAEVRLPSSHPNTDDEAMAIAAHGVVGRACRWPWLQCGSGAGASAPPCIAYGGGGSTAGSGRRNGSPVRQWAGRGAAAARLAAGRVRASRRHAAKSGVGLSLSDPSRTERLGESALGGETPALHPGAA